MQERMRADVALFQRGLVSSRMAAQRAIEQGRAFADDRQILKPSEGVSANTMLRVTAAQEEFVSRGAYKLMGALDSFGVDPKGLVCADLGASTGGFTQVLLRHGAKKVYAIDVGENQLAQELREDARVISMEKCNARALQADNLPEQVDLVVYDVSFISATLLFDAMQAISKPDARIIGLIKPQFEAGKGAIGKNGIVKRAADHEKAIDRCREAALQHGWNMTALIVSPIRGGDGNIEYLCLLECRDAAISDKLIHECVRKAHAHSAGT